MNKQHILYFLISTQAFVNEAAVYTKHKKANIEENFDDFEVYDFAICLFGLHWMNNLENAVKAIHKSLKKGGMLLAVIPYQMKDLYHLRCEFIKSSQWSSAFGHLNPSMISTSIRRGIYPR